MSCWIKLTDYEYGPGFWLWKTCKGQIELPYKKVIPESWKIVGSAEFGKVRCFRPYFGFIMDQQCVLWFDALLVSHQEAEKIQQIWLSLNEDLKEKYETERLCKQSCLYNDTYSFSGTSEAAHYSALNLYNYGGSFPPELRSSNYMSERRAALYEMMTQRSMTLEKAQHEIRQNERHGRPLLGY